MIDETKDNVFGDNRMSDRSTLDVKQFIDAQKFSLFHWTILTLCFLVVVMDGYDTVAIGYVARSLSDDWNLAHEALGPVMSAALVGLGVGAFLGGPLADRYGRRKVIIGSTILFGAFTALCAVASTLGSLTVFRLMAGVGLGAAMPNSAALMSEFAPARVRSLTVNTQLMGFSAGMAIAGAASSSLIPAFGWRSVFVAGGIAPLVLAVMLIVWLPESVQFLVLRRPKDARIPLILQKLARSAAIHATSFKLANEPACAAKSQGGLILSKKYRIGTALLWVCYFMHLLIYYLLAGWMPSLFRDAGFSLKSASLISSMFPVGGAIGTVLVGYVMDRCNAPRVVGWVYTCVAAVTVLVGQTLGMPVLLCLLVFMTGAMVTSAGTSMTAISAQFYGPECRATGVSWMYTVGRFGAVFGVLVGGALTGIGWKFGAVFAILAIPALIAGMGLLTLARLGRAPSARGMTDLNEGEQRSRDQGDDSPLVRQARH
ncbi:MFS transporter [Cupriavidus sp. D39]|uniref:MFS transporter n=1 Tax=Cupriavidus sp. D39 TaxID=2997877 RepID=UPI002271A898|nr:MFS transporter [Cupriavidus sp. D39]MCY0853509.1 MFS transporter [Cupriavidus sp. D39]